MVKVIKHIIVYLTILSLTTGCWDSVGLEDLLLVHSLGIDISKDNPEQYLFTMGFPTIIEEAPQDKMEFSTEAPSLAKAKSNLQKKVYRQTSYDNIKVVVFSEEAARRGILVHVDSMFRQPLFRGTTRFTVVMDRAVDLLELKSPVALLVSNFVVDSIQQNYESTLVPNTSLRDFSHEYYSHGIEPALPFICYGVDRTELNIGCVALFKNDKMIYRLKGDESRAFMILRGEIKGGIYAFDYGKEGNFVSININGGKSKIKTEFSEDNLHIYHSITINSSLAEFTSKEKSLKKLEVLESHIAKEISKDLVHVLEILQKDIENDNIGYGLYVKANHPEYYDSENWNEQFSKAKIHIDIEVNIRTVGTIQ